MADDSPLRPTWLQTRDAGALWRVRSQYVNKVAAANGVRTERRVGYGTWGEHSFLVYNAEDAARVATALDDGTLRLDPRWRTDTPEGQSAARAHILGGFGCVLLFFVIVILLGLWASSCDPSTGGEPSYWH